VHHADGEWTCSGGQPVANAGGPLWKAAQALLVGLSANGAMLTWLDRGMPAAMGGPSPKTYGWLAGLENDGLQQARHEL
jgi:hypothetical protein